MTGKLLKLQAPLPDELKEFLERLANAKTMNKSC